MKEIEKQATETTGNLIQRLFGPAADELGMKFADNARVYRLKNQLKLKDKVEKILSEENISPKEVNWKVVLPLLEASSLEDDDDLQIMWANLLVNYIDPEKNLNLTVYPEILRQLSSVEVKLLKFMKHNRNFFAPHFYDFDNSTWLTMSQLVDIKPNLQRLGLLEDQVMLRAKTPNPNYKSINQPNGRSTSSNSSIDIPVTQTTTTTFYLTPFARNFLEACERKNNYRTD